MSRSLAMEILSAIASSARAHRHHDEGPYIDRDIQVGEFKNLEVAGPFDVEIQTGEPASVHVSGPEWALDNLHIEHEGDHLVIGCDGDCNGDVTIAITVKKLQSLRSAGSGDVSLDTATGKTFDCSNSGSGDLSIESVEADKIILSSAGSGDVRNRQGPRQRFRSDDDGLRGPVDGCGREFRPPPHLERLGRRRDRRILR